MKRMTVGMVALLLAATAWSGGNAQCITVKTKAANNAEAKFWYHVPLVS